MKNIKYLLMAFAASLSITGCSDDPTYTNGAAEDANCYGVYFPSQANATDLEFDPADPTELTLQVSRINSAGEITVPIKITSNKEGIFEADPITFADGQETTTFKVKFPTAEIGTNYTCSIAVEDPAYAKVYGDKLTGLSFSVSRVKWIDINTDKTISYKGQDYVGYTSYTSDVLTTFYGVGTNTYPVKVQLRADSADENYPKGPNGYAGIYRMLDAYGAIYPYNDPGDYDTGVYITIDASDVNKVFIPQQYMGIHWSYGNMSIWSLADYYAQRGGNAAPYYGKLEYGQITFPVKALLLSMAGYNDGGLYNANVNGAFSLVVAPDEVVDYNFALAKGVPADGKIDVMATLGADVASMKYAIFEGALSATVAAANSADMNNKLIETKEITATGAISVELEKTGIYTLVGNIYNAAGALIDYKYITFGYIKAGEEVPVVATVGLNVTDKYTPAGNTSENSLEFYAFGESVESAYFGVFETSKLPAAASLGAYVKANGKALTAEQLASLNGAGFAVVVPNLVSGTEYTAVMWAHNGYVSDVRTASATTNGVPHPLKRTYTANDITGGIEKTELFKTWNLWAYDYFDETTTARQKLSTVTFSENTANDGEDLDAINVKGLSLETTADDTIYWELYNGIVYQLKQQSMGSFTYNSQTLYLGTIIIDSATGQGSASMDYMMIGGLVGEGYMAFVCAPNYVASGYNFDCIILRAYSDAGLTTAVGNWARYSNIVLADPTVDAANPMSAAKVANSGVSQATLKAISQAAAEPTNFVELRGRARMRALIDEFITKGKTSATNYAEKSIAVETPKLGVAKATVSFSKGIAAKTFGAKEIRKDLTSKAIFE